MPDNISPKDSIIQKFFGMFSFRTAGSNKKPTIEPTKKGRPGTAENFPPYVQQLFQAFKTDISQVYNFEDRRKMYTEMDNMFSNNSIMNSAKVLTVHEIVQGDVNNQIVTVEAKDKKLQKRLEEALIRLNVDGTLFPTASNLVKYGDAGWILTFNKKGVAEILNVDPFDIDDRIEFTPHDVEKQMMSTAFNSMFRNMSNDSKLQLLAKNITAEDDYASFFRSYLFGFQVGSFILPPWRFLHFRNYETNSFFAPFGIPEYIYALAPVKMYDMALGLQILARQAKMPTDVYKLNFPIGGMPTDKLEMATQFIRAWQASGLRNTRKENNGLGEAQVTIKDLFEWEQQTPNIDLGRIDDIELLRDDIILATGLPRNFLDPNNGSFGNSGYSLVQQFKPFARKVYKFQTIMLEQISQMLKIDCLQSGEYELKDLDFKLSMPYPESQTNPELISSQRDLFDLSNSILDGIKERLSGGQEVPLPVDLIRQVYKKVTSFDPHTIDTWVDQFVAEREKIEKEAQAAEEEGSQGDEESSEDSGQPDFTFESFKRKSGSKLFENIVDEEIRRGRIGYATEHASGGRHYLSSRKMNEDFNLELYEKIEVESRLAGVRKLNEEYELKSTKRFGTFKNKIKKENTRIKLREEEMRKQKFSEANSFSSPEIDDQIDLDALNEGE